MMECTRFFVCWFVRTDTVYVMLECKQTKNKQTKVARIMYSLAIMKILVLTPWVPYPVTGACQQDRFHGLRQMKELGYDLHVIAKIHDWQPRAEVEQVFAQEGIPLTLIPYVKNHAQLLLQRLPRILLSPALIDGAALEYTAPDYEAAVHSVINDFKPDLAWIEYTPLWPLLRLLKSYNIPTIIKSSLDEPKNCRDENGWSLTSIIKSIPKYPGERIAARESDFLFAISPIEEQQYKQLGAVHTGTLPLRGLSQCLRRKVHADKDVLDVVFLSSNYNMGHNRDALDFLLQKIIPLVREKAPGQFRFHLTGKKFPSSYEHFLADDVRTTGFVPDIGQFLATMDIALCPWISGTGMQQKVFEPLCRGLPLITNHVAGYPFVSGEDVLLATTPDEYLRSLTELRSTARRQQISDAALEKATRLYSSDAVKAIAEKAINDVLAHSSKTL
jgi:hypothetical protein